MHEIGHARVTTWQKCGNDDRHLRFARIIWGGGSNRIKKLDLPPFIEADNPIVVGIDLLKECVQLGIRYRESSTTKGCLEFVLGQLSIVVEVDALE